MHRLQQLLAAYEGEVQFVNLVTVAPEPSVPIVARAESLRAILGENYQVRTLQGKTIIVEATVATRPMRWSRPMPRATTHVVVAGENLFRIALRYGMTWPKLAAVNHLFNPNLIFAGMRLAIPCSARSSSYAPQSNPYGPNPYSAAPAPNPYGAPPMNATPAPTASPGPVWAADTA